MAKRAQKSEPRERALSRERIVEAAIELLDAEGEPGLTFRALGARLRTGPGAIYWHITSKDELLVAAADVVVSHALGGVVGGATPRDAIHGVALGVYEAIDSHPWVGAQLSRAPWETAMLQIFERIGREVQALGVARDAQFTSAAALLSYVIGVSIQNAANGRLLEPSADRAHFLATVAARWQALDAEEYPFIRNVVATALPEHDDRADFLAGLELILAGIAQASGAANPSREPRGARGGMRAGSRRRSRETPR